MDSISSNTIKLVFSNTVTRLAGYPYGKRVFEEQARNKISYDFPITIVFPDQIIRVASSFAQGFFEEIIDNIGILGIGEKLLIKASDEKVTNSIIRNLQK